METKNRRCHKTLISRTALVLLTVLILGISTARAEDNGPITNLLSPLFSAPAMVLPGQSITLKVAHGAHVESAWLEDSFGKAAMLSLSQTPDGYIGSPSPTLRPGLFDLHAVTSSIDGKQTTEIQPRAVAVFEKFKSDFDFAFVSDLHFGAAETERVPFDNKKVYIMRRAFFEKLASLNVEFVLLGGDLNLYPESYQYSYPESYEFLTKLLVRPVFIVPGNHDLYNMVVESLGKHVYGTDYWARYYGPTYQSFRYGTLEFIGLNTCDWPPEYFEWGSHKATMTGTMLNSGIQKEQYDWMRNELSNAKDASEIVVFTHIPLASYVAGSKIGLPPELLPGVKKEQVIGSLKEAGVRDVFAGHVHVFKENQLAPGLTEYVNSNIGGKFMESKNAGFEVVHVRGGRIINVEKIEIYIP
ncbi:MAG: metallophosphoesterase [bacterium]